MRLLHALIDLVLAPICLGCDTPLRPGDAARPVCGRCRARLHPVPPPYCERCGAPLLATGRTHGGHGCDECRGWPLELVSARSACLLAPPADRLVHQLKYRGWKVLAPVLAERMATLGHTGGPGHDDVAYAPVPTTRARVRGRGYNQAGLIAEELARRHARPCISALRRGSARGTQTTLQPLARAANVAGAFAVEPQHAAAVAGAHIVLVDDVLTTGATAAECARTLGAAGVCCVRLVTFARALDARRLIQT